MDKKEEHLHEWETVPGWGVVVGVSKCKTCGKVSRTSDFPTVEKKQRKED